MQRWLWSICVDRVDKGEGFAATAVVSAAKPYLAGTLRWWYTLGPSLIDGRQLLAQRLRQDCMKVRDRQRRAEIQQLVGDALASVIAQALRAQPADRLLHCDLVR